MKKGFTLVELLAVILILSLIAAIAYPIVMSSLRDAKRSASDSQKKLVIEAASYWVSDHDNLLSDEVGNVYVLTINALKEGNYLSDAILEDLEHGKVLNNACVRIITQSHKYIYEFQDECQ